MNDPVIQPLPGRRPVYAVDGDEKPPRDPQLKTPVPPQGQSPADDDPASDANTESANHPNDDE